MKNIKTIKTIKTHKTHKNAKCTPFLDKQDITRILSEFPKIELSYEAVVHKKVPSNCMSLIPDGQNCFAWFTVYNEHNVCFLIDLQRSSVELAVTSFDESLSIGTILKGVLFYNNSQTDSASTGSVRTFPTKLFAIEDMFLHKGETTSGAKYSTVKFNIYKHMLKNELGKHAFTSKSVVFGLPIMHSNYEELLNIEQTQTLYRVKYVQFGTIDKPGSCKMLFQTPVSKPIDNNVIDMVNNMVNNNRGAKPNVSETVDACCTVNAKFVAKTVVTTKPVATKTQIFNITPDVQPDIYFLTKNGKDCGVACIPNYATSVMMNKLFRNLKENDNLDTLEESDDEEEFENENPHKFVYLERTFEMLCQYNEKFKKWVPMRTV
jgi:hypothetical protein